MGFEQAAARSPLAWRGGAGWVLRFGEKDPPIGDKFPDDGYAAQQAGDDRSEHQGHRYRYDDIRHTAQLSGSSCGHGWTSSTQAKVTDLSAP